MNIEGTLNTLEQVASNLRGWHRSLRQTTSHVRAREVARSLNRAAFTLDKCVDDLSENAHILAHDELVAYEGDVCEALADRLKEPLWVVKSDPNQALRRLLAKENL